MRPGNHLKDRVISLKDKLKEVKIYSLSRSSHFQKRKAKKIKALNLILSFYNSHLTGNFSLSGWAFQLGALINKPVSKQAVFDRVDADFINLCRQLVEKSFCSKYKGGKLLNKFKNVYIQDSSCIHLPATLYPFYQGNRNYRGNHSVAKIQVIYNLMKNTFEELKLTSFTRNDQAAAADILKFVRPADLIVRDLGYFVIGTLKEIIKLKAHFICPLRKEVKLFYQHNNQPVDLKKLVKNKKYLKRQVLLGAEQRLPVTLIAVKLDEKTVRHRQRCAIYDRDRRKKLTTEKLYLLGWDIFICSCEDLEPQTIQAIYSIRWQIEIIFKSWKSHLKLEQSIPSRLERPFIAEAVIFLTLLVVILFIMPVYRWALKIISATSLLKLTRFIAAIMPQNNWIFYYSQLDNNRRLIAYEDRNRGNFISKLALLT